MAQNFETNSNSSNGGQQIIESVLSLPWDWDWSGSLNGRRHCHVDGRWTRVRLSGQIPVGLRHYEFPKLGQIIWLENIIPKEFGLQIGPNWNACNLWTMNQTFCLTVKWSNLVEKVKILFEFDDKLLMANLMDLLYSMVHIFNMILHELSWKKNGIV